MLCAYFRNEQLGGLDDPVAAGGLPGDPDGAGGQRRRVHPGGGRPRRGHGGGPVRRRRASRRCSTPPKPQLGPVTILVNNASGWVADTFVPAAADRFGRAQAPVSAQTIDQVLGVDARAAALSDRRVRPPPRRPGRRVGPHHRLDLRRRRTGSPRRSRTAPPRRRRSTSPSSAATELARYGVTANVVHPPITDTGWINQRTAASAQSAGPPHRHAPPGGRRHRLPGLRRRRPRHGQRHPPSLSGQPGPGPTPVTRAVRVCPGLDVIRPSLGRAIEPAPAGVPFHSVCRFLEKSRDIMILPIYH